jgi:ribosome biogenesis GTPase
MKLREWVGTTIGRRRSRCTRRKGCSRRAWCGRTAAPGNPDGNRRALGGSDGRFRLALEGGEAEMPAVGDWAAIDPRPTCDRAGSAAVLPRRTCLARQDAGRATRAQVLAANVDVAFLVGALDAGRGFSLARLERALALVRAGGAEAVAVLNKADLCDDIGGRVREAQAAAPDVAVIAVSATEGWGVEELRPWLAEGRTGVLLGPSGVGKSALANALLGEARQATGTVREEDARGRHTTTRRELFGCRTADF